MKRVVQVAVLIVLLLIAAVVFLPFIQPYLDALGHVPLSQVTPIAPATPNAQRNVGPFTLPTPTFYMKEEHGQISSADLLITQQGDFDGILVKQDLSIVPVLYQLAGQNFQYYYNGHCNAVIDFSKLQKSGIVAAWSTHVEGWSNETSPRVIEVTLTAPAPEVRYNPEQRMQDCALFPDFSHVLVDDAGLFRGLTDAEYKNRHQLMEIAAVRRMKQSAEEKGIIPQAEENAKNSVLFSWIKDHSGTSLWSQLHIDAPTSFTINWVDLPASIKPNQPIYQPY